MVSFHTWGGDELLDLLEAANTRSQRKECSEAFNPLTAKCTIDDTAAVSEPCSRRAVFSLDARTHDTERSVLSLSRASLGITIVDNLI